jgi:hypothetical protein
MAGTHQREREVGSSTRSTSASTLPPLGLRPSNLALMTRVVEHQQIARREQLLDVGEAPILEPVRASRAAAGSLHDQEADAARSVPAAVRSRNRKG